MIRHFFVFPFIVDLCGGGGIARSGEYMHRKKGKPIINKITHTYDNFTFLLVMLIVHVRPVNDYDSGKPWDNIRSILWRKKDFSLRPPVRRVEEEVTGNIKMTDVRDTKSRQYLASLNGMFTSLI